jgi:hypothetical protein
MTVKKELAHSDRGLSHESRAKSEVRPKNRSHYRKNWKWPRGAGQAALHTILTLIGLAMGVGSSSGDLQL